MIEGLAGLLMNLWIIAAMGFVLGIIFISFTASYLISIQSCFNSSAKEKFIWAMALLPWISGVFFVLLCLTPSITLALGWSVDHCHIHSHGHLCWRHPLMFDYDSWKMIFGLIVTGLVLLSMSKMLFRYYRQASSLGLLQSLSTKRESDIYIYENDQPHAFTAGLGSPQIFISTGLMNQLDHRELSIVVQHERLHQQRRDPLRLWLFNLLVCVLGRSSRRQLSEAMELAIEQSVDARVAISAQDAPAVAQTLLKVNRLELHYFKRFAISCAFCTTALEARIQQLLAHSPGRQFPLLSFVLSICTICITSIYHADALHHLLENFLHQH